MAFQSGASLILGGARSGKSSFAERLADQSNRRKIYLATSQAWDGEMERRIQIHRERRGDDWNLIEEPTEIEDKIADLANSQTCILVDCLTLWLTNLMMADADIQQRCDAFVSMLGSVDPQSSILLVSNEVGQGIVPIEKMAREFRDHAGLLHQNIAATVPNVWFVTAGIPQKLK